MRRQSGRLMQNHTLRARCLAALAAGILVGCASTPQTAAKAANAADMPWLARLTFGVNSGVLAQYQKLGRNGFLEAQLRGADEHLPDAVAQDLAQLPLGESDATRLVL